MSASKLDPIFKYLPESLKDPKGFKRIEKALIGAVVSRHQHKDIKEYVACQECSLKLEKKRALLKDFGFKDYNQYSKWRKVMVIMNSKQFSK